MTDTPTPEARQNPYVGPRAFRTNEVLFGRDSEIDDVTSDLIARRIVLLYSPSGAGKSSLLEAGLRPELEDSNFVVRPTIRVGLEPPPEFEARTGLNRYRLSTLLSLEKAHEGTDAERDADELADMTLSDYLDEMDGREPEPEEDEPPRRPVYFFDQFEELFTLDPTDVDEKAEFIDDLGEALSDRGRWALFAMREDFIAQLDPHLERLPTRLAARYRLDLLDVEAARLAIREPARASGVDFTVEAADHLIDDLRRVRVQRAGRVDEELGTSVESVQLQVVCHQLWNALDR